MFKPFSKIRVAGKTFEVKDAAARDSVAAIEDELTVIHDDINMNTTEISDLNQHLLAVETEINEKVLNVTIESDGFGNFRANYNDNDINNFRNNGGLVQAKYDTGTETYTYYYSTMESDRRPAFIRTYIENGIGKQVIIRIGYDKKVEVETRVTSSMGVSKEYVDNGLAGKQNKGDYALKTYVNSLINNYKVPLTVIKKGGSNVSISGGSWVTLDLDTVIPANKLVFVKYNVAYSGASVSGLNCFTVEDNKTIIFNGNVNGSGCGSGVLMTDKNTTLRFNVKTSSSGNVLPNIDIYYLDVVKEV